MPLSKNWPFHRINVDHIFRGTTRVWWQLDSTFTDPAPYTFQLQAGYTGSNDALDWADVGLPAANAAFLEDPTIREPGGKRLLTHYRVIMTTPRATYVSNPVWLWGRLEVKDWNFARELVRKERLRFSNVDRDGYLLRRLRYGVKNEAALDSLTDEIIDSGEMASWGTAFKAGYHPAVAYPIEYDPKFIVERRGGGDISTHNSNPDEIKARVIAFPDIAKEDIWVDEQNDQRWVFDDIQVSVHWRGVPLVYEASLKLLPHNHVAYKIPVSPEAYDPGDDSDFQPTTGTGCVFVDHDYGGDSELSYLTPDCCGIGGANIQVFCLADWEGGLRTREHAVATSQTIATGAWAWGMKLDPGDYIIKFEKAGEYGPDTCPLRVDAPEVVVPVIPQPPPPLSSLMSESLSEESSESTPIEEECDDCCEETELTPDSLIIDENVRDSFGLF